MSFVYIPTLVVGVLLLLLGRRLFWLFVAAVGFVAAFGLIGDLLVGQPDWVQLGLAVGAGIVGAVVAISLQWVAVGIGGFLGGGHLALRLVQMIEVDVGQPELVVFGIGGIIGAVLAFVLFDPVLVLLSATIGASMVVDALGIGPRFAFVAFAGLAILGVLVQTTWLDKAKPAARPG